jgi:hypothetical protein
MADYLGLQERDGTSGLNPGDVIFAVFPGQDCNFWEVIGLSEPADGGQAVVVIPAQKRPPGNIGQLDHQRSA